MSTIIEAKLLDDPGHGFQSRDEIYTIARRLMSHTQGKVVGGYTTTPDGKVVPVPGAYDLGDLSLSDAMYAVEYALTRGLNPYGHIHTWYQRSNKSPLPQLIVDIDWKILKGWAEWRAPFKTEYIEMSPENRQKYGLGKDDLGSLAYNILDAESHYFHQYQLAFIQKDYSPAEARHLAAQAVAKSAGVGIVRAAEMKSSSGKLIPPPKGRSWQWRAETRAFRDATRRSHGEPPPAQIRAYADNGGLMITQNHLSLMAGDEYPDDMPPEIQQKYLTLSAQAEGIKAMPAADLSQAAQNNIALMRDNGDDDPLDLPPDEAPPEIEESWAEEAAADFHAEEAEAEEPTDTNQDNRTPSTRFWQWVYSQGIERDIAGEYIRQAHGDFDSALKLIKKDVAEVAETEAE